MMLQPVPYLSAIIITYIENLYNSTKNLENLEAILKVCFREYL